ncbi:fused response regulator/phosphatase [Cypionkella aquatica]|uniref:Fused response regulator/phosphatase n=1 Tax=Cypionkella aquatica TaxID=1756042 RepID=A0AA37U090_9RHOB|nr:SpoIIE family protein phosphatase [Cypionkella aquatica]GLS86311.1 fused response regulator/phosphatase [Cypionkella aquatica]
MTSSFLPLSGIVRRPSAFEARPVLVVDDSKAQRKILQMQLTRWGYDVTEAASGDEALALCMTQDFHIVLSDWMMPGMNGLDFCKAFRALPREGYGYFILLTSKSEKTEIADGLENGADDFLTKPVSADELRARLRAGERILGMQDELVENNRLIGSTLAELQKLYDSLDRDLIEARKLQQTLVRDRLRDFGAGRAALMLRPSGHVGGDLVGSFVVDAARIVVYSVDVSGHGVASAMMTARLAGLLSGASPDQNIALRIAADGGRDAWPPAIVAARLNRMMLEELQVDQYFTLGYAEINLATGRASLVQAGHPHPLLLRADGRIEKLGDGGLPIGLIEGAEYPQTSFELQPGDRLFLVSDGVTECPNPAGEELGSDGLIKMLQHNSMLHSQDLLEALLWDLNTFAGGGVFPDDVSGLIFDYLGPDPDSS